MSTMDDEISLTAASEALGVTTRQARRLADEHGLALDRDANGYRRLSATRVAALAIARATAKARR